MGRSMPVSLGLLQTALYVRLYLPLHMDSYADTG